MWPLSVSVSVLLFSLLLRKSRKQQHRISQLFVFGDQTPAPACFGNLAEKSSASGAFRGLIFLQTRAAPVITC